MGSLLAGAIGLGIAVLQYLGNHEALKYVDQLKQAETDLMNEKAKGYNSDDAKIEGLQAQIGILLQAVQNQLAVYSASHGQQAPAVPAAAPVHPADGGVSPSSPGSHQV